jgi:hypothetical protein
VIVVVASLWRPRAAVGLVRFRFYDWLLHSFNSYSLSSPASVSPNGGHQPYARGIPQQMTRKILRRKFVVSSLFSWIFFVFVEVHFYSRLQQ